MSKNLPFFQLTPHIFIQRTIGGKDIYLTDAMLDKMALSEEARKDFPRTIKLSGGYQLAWIDEAKNIDINIGDDTTFVMSDDNWKSLLGFAETVLKEQLEYKDTLEPDSTPETIQEYETAVSIVRYTIDHPHRMIEHFNVKKKEHDLEDTVFRLKNPSN